VEPDYINYDTRDTYPATENAEMVPLFHSQFGKRLCSKAGNGKDDNFAHAIKCLKKPAARPRCVRQAAKCRDAPIWRSTDIPITDILGPILADTDIPLR
jgi:hypothetical protein